MLRRAWNELQRAVLGNERWARRNKVRIGVNCRVLSNVVTSEPWLVSIGDHTTISSNVVLVTHDGSSWLYEDERGRRVRLAPISIGSNCFIGTNSIVMPGVKIGDRCVVGAGSVVTKSVPDGHVVAGNPARIVTTFDELSARMKEWKSFADMTGTSRRERLDSVTDRAFRPEMSFGKHLST